MANNLGDFDTSAVIYGKFTTYRPSTGASFTLGGSPVISVYKDNSVTQSTTGVTLTADFDGVTGLNHFAIDTSADGTFYSAGSFFDIVITTGTVDSVSVTGSCVGQFTLRKTSALMPTTAGRTLDVSAGGEAGVDWANVGSPTTSLALTGTTIATTQKVDIETIKTNPVVNGGTITFPTTATLASTTNITAGTVTTATNVTTVNGLAAGVITAASIAADAITDAKVASDVTIASVTGAVGSVTGAVGSVTGNVGGNVTGSVGSIATGGIVAASFAASMAPAAAIATDAITDAKVAADVTIASVTGAVGSVTGAVGSVTGSVGSVVGAVGSVTGNVGGNVTGSVGSVAAGGIAAASFAANAITAAKLDPDVTTELQAGLATSSAVSTLQTSVDDLPTNAELATALGTADDAVLTQVALVKAKTDQLTFTVTNQLDANIQYVNDVQVNGTGASGSRWGP